MTDSDTRMVDCVVLGHSAPGLDAPPHPGELGERIYQSVSREGWEQWLERLVTIVNENGMNTAEASTVELIQQHMVGFLFGEGDLGQLPDGFDPNAKRKK